jgi:hypothetical protein
MGLAGIGRGKAALPQSDSDDWNSLEGALHTTLYSNTPSFRNLSLTTTTIIPAFPPGYLGVTKTTSTRYMEQHHHGANLFADAFHYMFGRRTSVNGRGHAVSESTLQPSHPNQPVRLPPLKRRLLVMTSLL